MKSMESLYHPFTSNRCQKKEGMCIMYHWSLLPEKPPVSLRFFYNYCPYKPWHEAGNILRDPVLQIVSKNNLSQIKILQTKKQKKRNENFLWEILIKYEYFKSRKKVLCNSVLLHNVIFIQTSKGSFLCNVFVAGYARC